MGSQETRLSRSCLVAAVLAMTAAPAACPRAWHAPQVREVAVGETTSGSVGDRSPLVVYNTRANASGILSVSLSWPDRVAHLCLAVWNGDAGEGSCSRSGESARVRVRSGDSALIRVSVRSGSQVGTVTQFRLTTSLRRFDGTRDAMRAPE
jgi:hypothetical protein